MFRPVTCIFSFTDRTPAAGRSVACATLGVLAALFAGFLAPSCHTESTLAPKPDYQVGVFEGQVLAGGIGTEADVGARAASGLHRGEILFVTHSDSTGHYRLAVPAGTYWLELNPGSGHGSFSFPGIGDTLAVTDHVRTVDIRCARVH